jgi:hypothetical protein
VPPPSLTRTRPPPPTAATQELPAASVPAARRAYAPGPAQQHYAEIGGGAGAGGGAAAAAAATGVPAGTALVAPWALCRLAAVLRDSQQEFEVFADPEPTSCSLNPAPVLGAAWSHDYGGGGGGAAPAPAGVGVSGLELGQWGAGARQLAGRHVRQLRFADGTFSARLGAP